LIGITLTYQGDNRNESREKKIEGKSDKLPLCLVQ